MLCSLFFAVKCDTNWPFIRDCLLILKGFGCLVGMGWGTEKGTGWYQKYQGCRRIKGWLKDNVMTMVLNGEKILGVLRSNKNKNKKNWITSTVLLPEGSEIDAGDFMSEHIIDLTPMSFIGKLWAALASFWLEGFGADTTTWCFRLANGECVFFGGHGRHGNQNWHLSVFGGRIRSNMSYFTSCPGSVNGYNCHPTILLRWNSRAYWDKGHTAFPILKPGYSTKRSNLLFFLLDFDCICNQYWTHFVRIVNANLYAICVC